MLLTRKENDASPLQHRSRDNVRPAPGGGERREKEGGGGSGGKAEERGRVAAREDMARQLGNAYV